MLPGTYTGDGLTITPAAETFAAVEVPVTLAVTNVLVPIGGVPAEVLYAGGIPGSLPGVSR